MQKPEKYLEIDTIDCTTAGKYKQIRSIPIPVQRDWFVRCKNFEVTECSLSKTGIA